MNIASSSIRGAVVVLTVTTVAAGLALAAENSGPLPPWGPPFSLEKSKAYRCVRAQGPIVLDGRLDEPSWARAQRIEGFIIPPSMDWVTFSMKPAVPANSDAVVRLMWDDKFLYFGAEVYDRDIYATHSGHDEPFGNDDLVELFVKPSRKLPYYWEFHMMPSGGTRDYFYARRGAGGADRWLPYESGMKMKARVIGTLNNWQDRDQKWIVEMKIPWSAFARWGGRPKVGDYWNFLVARYDYSVYLKAGLEHSAAAPLPYLSYHLFEYYPYLTFVE